MKESLKRQVAERGESSWEKEVDRENEREGKRRGRGIKKE